MPVRGVTFLCVAATRGVEGQVSVSMPMWAAAGARCNYKCKEC